MTVLNLLKKAKLKGGKIAALALSVLFTALIFASAIYLSDDLSKMVLYGLNLSVKVIIPSVFPFLILTDFAMQYIAFEKVGFLKRAFEKIFKINGGALAIFICGLLGGFPVGANLSIIAYRNGLIKKGECERLLVLANNASPGYVISGIGIALRGSIRDGIILYSAMVSAAILTGWITGLKSKEMTNTEFIDKQNYCFTKSIKHAATVCINVSAFITVFSILSGITKIAVKNRGALAVILSFLEIGNAGVYLSDLCIFSPAFTLSLTAFSISFSGLCVYAQTASLIPNGLNISMAKYLPIKLAEGIIAMGFSLFFNLF